jgi:parallel beta-helix repeat protein
MLHALRLLLLGTLLVSPLATRAETYATCTGFIDTVPAVISTQGTWCLRQDLGTSVTTGQAVLVATNNVTIDCNGYKIGGLSAGATSMTAGVRAVGRQNVTVRNCNVRGFYIGLAISSGSGHLIEDNRIDNSLYSGIFVNADDTSLIRDNRVFDTGGAPDHPNSIGIYARGDVIGNVVSGVFGDNADSSPDGIAQYSGVLLQGNRVDGLVTSGSGTARGLSAYGHHVRIQGNHVTATAMAPGIGVYAPGQASFCLENTVSNYLTAFHQCESSAGNMSLPSP